MRRHLWSIANEQFSIFIWKRQSTLLHDLHQLNIYRRGTFISISDIIFLLNSHLIYIRSKTRLSLSLIKYRGASRMNPQGIPTTSDSSNLRGNTLDPRQGGEFTTDGYPRPTVLPWIRCKVCADTSSTVYRIDARMHVCEIPGLAITEFLRIFHFRQHCFPSGPDSWGMPPVRGEKHVAVLLLANPYRSVVNSTVEGKRR